MVILFHIAGGGCVTGGSKSVSKHFSRPGFYHATLTITDDKGAKDTDTVTVHLR